MHGALFLVRLILSGAFLAVLVLPAWWAAGRLLQGNRRPEEQADPALSGIVPFFRFLFACGLALVGYVSSVNLLGRLTGNSVVAVVVTLFASAAACVVFYLRSRPGLSLEPLSSTWRAWIGPVLLAAVLGLPQLIFAVTTNYWDEAACSAIHLTAPNQFAEGVFPPRHNALPDIPIKYHYGFVILSGTVRWLTGLSANVSIDIASTALWLFIFLFIYYWLREVEFGPLPSLWGSFAVLLGGGLSWLYLKRIEVYDGLTKSPPASDVVFKYDAARSWIWNLIKVSTVPSLHLRNTDGSLSNLPWDTAALFEQHPVSLGIALTVVALYLFTVWQRQTRVHIPLAAANVAAFGVLFLGHAVFGGVGAITASVCLLGAWLRRRTLVAFLRGSTFGPGVAVLALLHGGMLTRGPQYGAGGFTTMRKVFGYATGGLRGFLDWNLAAFGLLLLLAIAALVLHYFRREPGAVERNTLFWALTVFTVFSYMVPQVMYYSAEGAGVEQFTEISKFFFSGHFGLALLSVFGVDYLMRGLDRRTQWAVALPAFAAVGIAPLAFCYAVSFGTNGRWPGFYHSPYFSNSIEEQMGTALARFKHGPRDVYFDASADERVHGYLSEMLIFGGSVFTMTPSRFERTGIGFRLSEKVVADRYTQNSRIARLVPGAPEQARCQWYYARPVEDLVFRPQIVRSRFAKAVAEGVFFPKLIAGKRVLYSIDKPTSDLDRGIDRYWLPRIVAQAKGTDWNGDGKRDLIFYDYLDRKIRSGTDAVDLPPWLAGEFANIYVGKFPGEPKVDFLVGRMKDTTYHMGKKIEDLEEYDGWAWTYRDSHDGVWQPEYAHWYWNLDIPFIADLDNDGFDSHLAYRVSTGEWLLAVDKKLPGPKMDRKDQPLPFGGRFLEGSRGDLGLWSLQSGTVSLQSLSNGRTATFKWGGRDGDVLVPADYDGDGYDEIGVWQRTNQTWYWRRAPDGPISQATLGTPTCVPLPADYDHDGRVDLAYWEPAAGKIYVSFNRGRTVDLTIVVPPHSLPAFVNMY